MGGLFGTVDGIAERRTKRSGPVVIVTMNSLSYVFESWDPPRLYTIPSLSLPFPPGAQPPDVSRMVGVRILSPIVQPYGPLVS